MKRRRTEHSAIVGSHLPYKWTAFYEDAAMGLDAFACTLVRVEDLPNLTRPLEVGAVH